MRRPTILAAGGVTVDNIVTDDGRLFLSQVGGNAVHAAVGAAIWGVAAGVAGRIPADYPHDLHSALAASGLDLKALRVEAACAPLQEWFFHHADGSRADHLHALVEEAEAFGVAADRLPPERAAAWAAHLIARTPRGLTFAAFRRTHPVVPDLIPEAAWPSGGLHVGAGEPESMLALALAGRERRLVVTVDPGFASARFGEAAFASLLGSADAFLPSEKELCVFCPGLGREEAVLRLARQTRGVVCAKFGAEGALLGDRDTGLVRWIPPYPCEAVDPVGAGDAFAGGLLAGLVRGDEPAFAALRGAVSASFAVGGAGALHPVGTSVGDAERRLNDLARVLNTGGHT